MSLINIDAVLAEISSDSPCGPNMEYDRAFSVLDEAAQVKPEQQIGETIIPAQEPDWRAVKNQALKLLEQTKDLRIAGHLTRALLNTDGFPGFAEGLALLRGLVERYWGSVHPQLDPDDDNDPTMRVNTLMGLCDAAVLVRVRATPLVASRSFGRFGLREIDLAVLGAGAQPEGSDSPVPDMSAIEGAFTEVPLDALQATAEAVHGALQHLNAIEAFVGDQVGSATGPSFAKLTTLLRQGDKLLTERLTRRGAGAAVEEVQAGVMENNVSVAPGGAVVVRAAGAPLTGEITSREDVVRVLEKICAYYERNEPSSPIPLMLERCKRLVTMGFLDIIRDVAPDAIAQAELLRGRTE